MDEYIWPEITVETTIDELREIHRHIWDYAIENGHKPATIYRQDCVACEYNHKVIRYLREHGSAGLPHSCYFCPIKWPGPAKCNTPGNLYNAWVLYDLSDVEDEVKSGIAKLIRDVEWKEDGYFE